MGRYRSGYYNEEHREKKKPSVIVIVIIVALLVVVGYLAVTRTSIRMSQPPKEMLVVGTNTPFPPFELRKGEIIGFDIDLAQKIAERLNRTLVIKDFSDFDALLPILAKGELDMVASAVTIRPDRDEVVDFSASYFNASQAVLVTKESAFRCAKTCQPQDFSGAKVGYQEGTTSQFWVEDNILVKINLAANTPFDDLAMGLQLLRLGAVDMIVVDKPVAESFAKSYQDLVVAGTIETGEQYGFVVQEGDTQNLLPTINKVIKELKESGEYDKLIKKWFGTGSDGQ